MGRVTIGLLIGFGIGVNVLLFWSVVMDMPGGV